MLIGFRWMTYFDKAKRYVIAMKKTITVLLAAACLMWACSHDQLADPLDTQLFKRLSDLSPNGDIDYFILPESDDYASIPQGVKNPITSEKVALGNMLFFETGLARNAMKKEGIGTFSCGSCHVPSAGFMPGRPQGIADGGIGFGLNGEDRIKSSGYEEEELDVQGARPLSLLNVAFVSNTSWNGQFGAHGVNEGTEEIWDLEESTEVNHLGLDGIESQNIEGLKLHRMEIDGYVLDTLGYRALFDEAFYDFPVEERYSFTTASFAISSYIRTLIPNKAPFQRWMKGDLSAMTDLEKKGASVFYGKAGCFRCHKGPALNSVEFHALGVKDLYETGAFKTDANDRRNKGRGGFTRKAEDLYKFKVPQIYNMGDSPFYFHGSSKHSLREVVEYFNEGMPENTNVPAEQVSPLFHPLYLTTSEKEALVEFLENGLRDPDLERYMPASILSNNCFPNNDPISQEHLGCK